MEKIQAANKYILSSVPFWRRISNLRNKKQSIKIGTIKINGHEVKSDKEKADHFAKRLKGIFSLENDDRYDDLYKARVDKYFDDSKFELDYKEEEKAIKLITSSEIKDAISNLNNKNSIDESGVSNRILKRINEVIIEKVLHLFNRCLLNQRLPYDWKFSRVSMLLKKDQDPEMLKSYRPISLTLCLARLFEKIILKRLQGHLRKNKIIVKNQSGFRHGRQTRDNISFLAQKVKEQFNKNGQVLSIFFDIASAFDKVWHRGL